MVLIAVILSILAVIILAFLSAVLWTAGEVYGFGITMSLPQGFGIALLVLKAGGLVMGIVALYDTSNNDFSRAGIFAVISCILPPLDLMMLIGGYSALSAGREMRRSQCLCLCDQEMAVTFFKAVQVRDGTG